jgi:hypothetical protein
MLTFAIIYANGADVNNLNRERETHREYTRHLGFDESRAVISMLIDAGVEIPITEDFFVNLFLSIIWRMLKNSSIMILT